MSETDVLVDPVDDSPNENASLIVALVATGLAVVTVVGLALLSAPAAWVGGAGTVLLAVGVFGGIRGAVGWGVGLVGVAALIATRNDSLPVALSVAAATALICMAVLVTADMSLAMRRATVVSGVTLRGVAIVHAAAALTGVALSAVLVSVVLAVSWPTWFLLFPAVVLGIASFVMARQASRYNAKMRPVQRQPGMKGRMPLPPPPRGVNGPSATSLPPAPPAAGGGQYG